MKTLNQLFFYFLILVIFTNCQSNSDEDTPNDDLKPDGTFIDTRDDAVYKWVKIGNQIWMAENLAYLPAVSPPTTGSSTTPHYYVYDYTGSDVPTAKKQRNYTTYGVLYNWPAAKAACPPGWHLPSDAEWKALESYLIANGYNYDGTTTEDKIAKSLAAITNWDKHSDAGAIGNNLSLNNKSGFSALPGGNRGFGFEGAFVYINIGGYWWTSTEANSTYAKYVVMYYSDVDMALPSGVKSHGFSIRCVKD